MPRTLKQIIHHIRACVRDPKITATLIQTEDLTRLCDAAEGKRKPPTRKPPTRKPPTRKPPTRKPPTRSAA